MTLRKTGLAGTAALIVMTAAAVAGCAPASSSSSSGSAATPGASGASGASASSSSASSASSASSGAATPAAPGTPSAPASNAAGTPPACATRDLKASAGTAQGAAGSVYRSIDFTNTGGAACTLYGFPGMALTTGTAPSTQIGAAATRSTPPGPSVVTLQPGGVANAVLRVTQALDYPTSTCHPVTSAYLQIYPPGQTAAIYLPFKSTGCSATSVKLLFVGVVQAGAGNRS